MNIAETSSDRPSSSCVGSIMQSFASRTNTNYEFLDNNDHGSPLHQPDAPRSASPEPAVRSASPSRPIPLRHPVPDLQSLQGAYVGNVERLEKSAERLSMKSDIDEELRKMKLEQRHGEQHSPSPPASPTHHASFSHSIGNYNPEARSGRYSTAGYISPPRESIVSNASSQHAAVSRTRGASIASRLERVPEPEMDDVRDGDASVDLPPLSNSPEGSYPYDQSYGEDYRGPAQDHHLGVERPTTAGSTDTYRQAAGLFGDFDGVHFYPGAGDPQHSRQISLSKPPLAGGSRAYKEPPPGENSVYYPAPVPMVLNLPQRLSKQPPISEREKRRTKVLSSVPVDARKSAAWLHGEGSTEDVRRSAHMSSLPPQLRASAFFDQAPTHLDVEVSHESAVSTLDSILDASAKAPVSAFTDHPFAGHVGAEVYGKSKNKKLAKNAAPAPVEKEKEKRKRLSKPMDSRQSLAPSENRMSRIFNFGNRSNSEVGKNGSAKNTPPRVSQDGTTNEHHYAHDGTDETYRDDRSHSEDENGYGERDDDADGEEEDSTEDSTEEEDEDEEDEEEDNELNYVGQPTTLLAELQLRKQEQKQRTKAAAVAYPNGMHSTLLELDAVRQIQHKTRQQRHVTLAWEASEKPDHHSTAGGEDEDVPLGVLFPENKKTADENRPLGLMAKREIEENEPLSKRRARLRGEPAPVRSQPQRQSVLDMPLGDDEESENEGETLAQRVRRLKGEEKRASIFGDDFASEIMSQLGGKLGDASPEAKSPPEEETLGQRRKRLQAEKAAEAKAAGGAVDNPVPAMKTRRSMADILQAHPVSGARRPHPHEAHRLNSLQPDPRRAPYGNHMSTGGPTYPNPMAAQSEAAFHGQPQAFPSFGPTAYGNGMNYVAPIYNQASMNGFGYGTGPYVQESMMRSQQQPQDTIDPKQRDMIDRWRQSVMQ